MARVYLMSDTGMSGKPFSKKQWSCIAYVTTIV